MSNTPKAKSKKNQPLMALLWNHLNSLERVKQLTDKEIDEVVAEMKKL